MVLRGLNQNWLAIPTNLEYVALESGENNTHVITRSQILVGVRTPNFRYNSQCPPERFSPDWQRSNHARDAMRKKPKTKRPGKVQKIIKSVIPDQPEKAEIAVEGADHLYREIRIENRLEDEHGNEVKLKEGADVEVVVEADVDATVPTSSPRKKP